MPNVALVPGAETTIPLLTAFVDGFPEGTHKLETLTGGGGAPVEDGRKVTDHAVALASKLTLTGYVSGFTGGNRPADAWGEIRRLHKAGKTVTVITEWGVYPEMIIRTAEAPQTGRGMRFTLELEEVLRVEVEETTLPPHAVDGPATGRSGEVHRGRVPLGPPMTLGSIGGVA